MIGRLVDLIGARAGALVIALALLAAGNVALQMFTHKSTALTAWKGGGFGMYTEPHPDSRSVWLTFSTGVETSSLRLWPEAENMTDWRGEVSLKGRKSLGKVTAMAERLRFYPSKEAAHELLALVLRIRWKQELTGGLSPKEGKTFSSEDISLEIFENAYDIKSQRLNRLRVFGLKGEG